MAKSFNAQMKERFARISSSYDAANKLAHETALLIFDHAKEHGDCSSAQGLVMALPASVRRETMITWFRRYSPIVVKNSDDWNAKMHKTDSKNFVPWNREEAEANPFYIIAKQEKEAGPPLTDEAILKLISGLAKRLETKVDEGEVAPEFRDSTMDAVAALKRIRVKASKPANDSAADETETAAKTKTKAA